MAFLKQGDIVPVRFGESKSTKTLALILTPDDQPCPHGGDDGTERYDVLYNDGTTGLGLARSNLGDPISSDDILTLVHHSFRDLTPWEVFQVFIRLRIIALSTKHVRA